MGLKHPFHKEHPLTLRILSEDCKVECSICDLDIHGPSYCCEGCDYFLHGSCAVIELPPEIRHPYHPEHPLTLSDNVEHSYSCNKCSDFNDPHALAVLATLPPLGDEEEEGMVRHFAHDHPLTSFHVKIQLVRPQCEGCQGPISGQIYGCRACLFLLHASCAQSPRVIYHPPDSGLTLSQYDADSKDVLHGCRFCGEYIESGFVYSRADGMGGSFSLHMACALAIKFPKSHQFTSSTNFKVHHSHPCPLVLLHIEGEAYGGPIQCRICELELSGDALGCPRCGFFLHKSCAEKLPEEIHHYLHPEHFLKFADSLKLVEAPTQWDEKYRCASCRSCVFKSGLDNMSFQCDNCEFYLHPNCALHTLSVVEEGVAASVSHVAHHHPLHLHSFSYEDVNYCIACWGRIYSLAYCCVTCDYIKLHKSCAELPKQLQHPFHSQHLLVLLSKGSAGYLHCSICSRKSEGFAYYCAECEFYLDVGCATLNPTVKHPRHEHKLAYFKESENNQVQCNACRKICTKDFLNCVPCDFRLHHDCLPLPPETTHEGHVHPLVLRDKFVDGDPNYQYCDHCEELRNPDHGLYRCEDCWFSAHIDCIISMDEVEEVEENGTESEAEGTETSEESVFIEVYSEANAVRVKAGIDVMRRNIDTMTGSLEELMEKVKELEMEKESL